MGANLCGAFLKSSWEEAEGEGEGLAKKKKEKGETWIEFPALLLLFRS